MIEIAQKVGRVSLLGISFLLVYSLRLPASAQTSPIESSPITPSTEAETIGIQELPMAQQPESIAQQSESGEDSDGGVDRINYFGIGGTIGLSDDGDTALGDGGFSLMGRFSITDNISVHSASTFGDNSISTFALTGGAPIRNQETGRIKVFPFLGAGIAVQTSDDFEIDPMVTGGVDIPITDIVTGTARINASFGNDGTDVGLVFGVGVNVLELF